MASKILIDDLELSAKFIVYNCKVPLFDNTVAVTYFVTIHIYQIH